ncbi:PLD nuclease N-terminal domain-containing protein [Nocardioides daphniae]|uniref:PLDc_N domain-containing protein n=1 Tax=Nocardioides daphniae TaxID=402297 RepID=A0A4P7UAZ9_9ACTN|nr:PLD nuclease N-terminal domain-containing protein [Nocardioides daphniae]QCC77283.1 PLDc_N domain-containing protein [Nocardioides daphniae]GGD25745.1 hypothetical protein GCM10007231_26400 [Nocardioides daphniae]
MARSRRKWNDLSSGQQTAVLVAGSVEMALTATALVELARRPGDQVRGRKLWWALACFVQPFGPVAFLVWGRRKR